MNNNDQKLLGRNPHYKFSSSTPGPRQVSLPCVPLMHILILDRTPPSHVTLQSAHGLQGDQLRNWVFKTKRPFLTRILPLYVMIVKLRQNFTKMREFSWIRDQKKLC